MLYAALTELHAHSAFALGLQCFCTSSCWLHCLCNKFMYHCLLPSPAHHVYTADQPTPLNYQLKKLFSRDCGECQHCNDLKFGWLSRLPCQTDLVWYWHWSASCKLCYACCYQGGCVLQACANVCIVSVALHRIALHCIAHHGQSAVTSHHADVCPT